MKSGLSFLVAARQCEIAELEQLAQTGELVGVLSRLTHALQRERGLSNVVLASRGERFAHQRLRQADACLQVEQEVRGTFDQLDTDANGARNGARLFSRIAVVLHALDDLPDLRKRIAAQALTPQEATEAFSRLIAGLLSVVFEAADTATDPEISRALVAMFNFMQGKEFAGQERAFGAAVFASGHIDAPGQHQWHDLIESQEGCFRIFRDFANAAVLGAERSSQDPGVLADLEKLRRVGSALLGEVRLDPSLSQVWYDCCTHRIDAMKTVEDLLSTELRRLCGRKITDARAQLRDQQAVLATLTHAATLAAPGVPAPYGPHLERSILDMVQEQSRRLQAISSELDTVRASLNERKVVERAKGLLMAHRQLSEEDAYRTLRQMAMNQNRKLSEVAASVLAIEHALSNSAA
jgi:hypothetical protein